VKVLIQPDLFWAIILGGCFTALALIAIPKDAGVLKDRDDARGAHRPAPHPIREVRRDTAKKK
jgi:hypothetical protein